MIGTRHGTLPGALVVGLLFAACQQQQTPIAVQQTVRSAPAKASCKPEAPIAIEIATRAIGDELEVVARATPSSPVASIELELVLPPHAIATTTTARFGATSPHEVRTLTTRVRVDQRTSSITAIARVPIADVVMARTATVAIGAPEPAPRTRTYAMPDGELAREVQP